MASGKEVAVAQGIEGGKGGAMALDLMLVKTKALEMQKEKDLHGEKKV